MKRILFLFLLFLVMAASTDALGQHQSYNRYNWTGFYLGFQGSFHAGKSEWEMNYDNERLNHDTQGGMGGILYRLYVSNTG